LELYELPEASDIIHYTRNQWKNIVKEAVTKRANELYTKEAATKKKLLTMNKVKRKITREKYLHELKWEEARTMFKARTNMLNFKANYKGSYQNPTCEKCNLKKDETQQHIIEECPQVCRQEINGLTCETLYSEQNPEKLSKIAKFLASEERARKTQPSTNQKC